MRGRIGPKFAAMDSYIGFHQIVCLVQSTKLKENIIIDMIWYSGSTHVIEDSHNL